MRRSRWAMLSGLVMALAAWAGGCAMGQPIPEASGPQSAAIGVEMALRAPIGLFSFGPDVVYFARIDRPEARTYEVVPSNYRSGGRAYLLGAEPGTYLAIGALRLQRNNQTGVLNRYVTRFSRELAEQTRIAVREGEFVFMGGYVVDNAVVTSPGDTILTGIVGDFYYMGSLKESRRDDGARQAFRRGAREDLAGTGWAARLR